jgi:hypothetical protein
LNSDELNPTTWNCSKSVPVPFWHFTKPEFRLNVCGFDPRVPAPVLFLRNFTASKNEFQSRAFMPLNSSPA